MSEQTHSDKIWDLVLKTMVALSITFFGWSIKSTIDLDKRLSVIESNRYTPADALEFERSWNQRWIGIENRMTKIESDTSAILHILSKGKDN